MMDSCSTHDPLVAEVLEQATVLVDLDGPQIEAWVSGLFPLFDDSASMQILIEACDRAKTTSARLVCAGIALIAEIDDRAFAASARAVAGDLTELGSTAKQIGASTLRQAWQVDAPFGRSIVLGYVNAATLGDEADGSHSILVELGADGLVNDLMMAGPGELLVQEAAVEDESVTVVEFEPQSAIDEIVQSWPSTGQHIGSHSATLWANQQLVRHRINSATGLTLGPISEQVDRVDISRGLDATEFAAANRAALSTLAAAVPGLHPETEYVKCAETWAGVIRGDGGELASSERAALLWLEWADWLGVGIGLLRHGAGAAMTGPQLVEMVNGCPEVSSSIDKADRAYAEWAFGIAIDLLCDTAAVVDNQLTAAGHGALGSALLAAWGEPADLEKDQ